MSLDRSNSSQLSIDTRDKYDILHLSFNQDQSCFAVGTSIGYKIYNNDPFTCCFQSNDGGIGIAEMLFTTSLVALVGAGIHPQYSPRRLQLINTKRQSVICELNFVTTVVAVKLNRRRLLVVLENSVHVYDISNMKLLHTIDTSPNPRGVIAMASSSENCYVAYPANNLTGEVLIFDANTLQTVNIIQAHKSTLSYLAMNQDGSLLATSSEKGTVIRVFSVPDGRRLYQFRRGSTSAKIQYISFNSQSNMICVVSGSQTIHIFRLSRAFGTGSAVVGSYLPEILSEMIEPVRDFAFIKLPSALLSKQSSSSSSASQSGGSASVGYGSKFRCIAALSNTLPQIIVCTSNGWYLQYQIDLENGGECKLLNQHSIIDRSDYVSSSLLSSADNLPGNLQQQQFQQQQQQQVQSHASNQDLSQHEGQ
ncbi:hypothetical protein MP228_004439 [Amoeboaphelidium protococcarum]|nr:hypothetical protein MP228_004439 [Amoeboaphelidium protococcarum]